MPHLGFLRLLERDAEGGEVRAGILQVAVEDQRVKLPRQVVVMGDALLRRAERIGLLDAAPQHRRMGDSELPSIDPPITEIEPHKVEKIIDRTTLDGQAPIDIGLTDRQPRIEGKPPTQAAIVQPDRHPGAAPGIAIAACPAVAIDDGQLATLDDGAEKLRQQHPSPPTVTRMGNSLSTPELYLGRRFSQVEADTRANLNQNLGDRFPWAAPGPPPGAAVAPLALAGL